MERPAHSGALAFLLRPAMESRLRQDQRGERPTVGTLHDRLVVSFIRADCMIVGAVRTSERDQLARSLPEALGGLWPGVRDSPINMIHMGRRPGGKAVSVRHRGRQSGHPGRPDGRRPGSRCGACGQQPRHPAGRHPHQQLLLRSGVPSRRLRARLGQHLQRRRRPGQRRADRGPSQIYDKYGPSIYTTCQRSIDFRTIFQFEHCKTRFVRRWMHIPDA